MPSSAAKRRPASSMRTMRPPASRQTRRAPDVERGEVDHAAVGADRDLRGAAAHVHIHHGRAFADRARRRARAVGGHHGFQAVAGRDRDHLAGLACKQLRRSCGHCAGAPRRRSGSARRYRSRPDRRWRPGTAAAMKAPSACGVDLFFAGIGREQDVGLVEGLARGHDIAAVEPLQHDAGEHEMRGRGADVDADARERRSRPHRRASARCWRKKCARRHRRCSLRRSLGIFRNVAPVFRNATN